MHQFSSFFFFFFLIHDGDTADSCVLSSYVLLFYFYQFYYQKGIFCQPDEINSKGFTNGVNESFSFSSTFFETQKRYIRYSKNSLLCLLLLVCGDISPNLGPQPSSSLKRFTGKRGFKILHQNINGISEKIDSVRGILQHKNIQFLDLRKAMSTLLLQMQRFLQAGIKQKDQIVKMVHMVALSALFKVM